jgi:HAD superfamily hydrolase (TIGR01662 family)
VAVTAVVFDFGYTLVDEDRVWRSAAVELGCPESVFFATLGAVIERRARHRDVFELLGAERQPRLAPFEARDFYDDALPALREAKARGHSVGIAGNFSREIESFLATNADVDFVASSERWNVEKPSPEFFARVVEQTACAPEEITYVGDRLDNDVLPATAAGMAAVWILRGPWAAVQQSWEEAASAFARVRNLEELSI